MLNKLSNCLYALFPIQRKEWSRFLPMAVMMLLILANYTVLRNVKDTLVTTARGSDANVIPYIKLMCTLPSAILFMLFYTRVASFLSRERVFYICVVPFLIFFGLFGAVIYPNIDVLHASHETLHAWREAFPRFQWIIVMMANWSYTLFYILAELWGSTILSLFFFQLANEITKTETAKRFYPMFGFIGNMGLIISGTATKMFSERIQASGNGANAMQDILNIMMPSIVVSGLVIMALYWWMCRISEHPEFELPVRKKRSKPKLGIVESLRYLMTSRYLMAMAIMVMAYGMSINFIDVLWKGQVKSLMTISYPDYGKEQLKAAYLAYMAEFSRTTGLISLPLMLGGGFILRRLSWFKAAVITPTILLVTGGGFFGVVLYGYWTGVASEPFMMMGQTWTLIGVAATFGYWQNALTKATKYSLFDATKEMAYFPLDDELRSKGKAAVDVVGGRAGKSGGSFILMGLQTVLPALALPGLSPYLLVIFVAVLAAWFVALGRLNHDYTTMAAESEAPAEPTKAEPEAAAVTTPAPSERPKAAPGATPTLA